jgi:YqaJ-like viral recombinase domain
MSRFTICTAEQRSPDWFAARLGRATGSKAAAILAKGKSSNEEAKTRRDYRVQLAVEQITGVYEDDDGFQSRDMRRGVEHESDAIGCYESFRGEITRRTGFLALRDCMAGCSLDFDVNDIEGFAEIKCPKASIHLEYIEENRIPPAYEKQILHNFWVSGAKWCDFVSYNALVPEHLRLFVIRVERDESVIKSYETAVNRFLAEVSLTVKKMREMKAAA